MTALTLGLAFAASCSSKTTDAPAGGGPVGSKCTADSQCTGYKKPTCVTALNPLEDLIAPDSGAPGAQKFRTLSLPFPGGYCSNTLADSCATDADCGVGGGCYRPFEGADPALVDSLNKIVPFDIRVFAKQGVCLEKCSADATCRTDEGYKCIVPLHAFVTLFNKPYTKTFCVQDPNLNCYINSCDGGI
jgi:hypothetical protein